MAKFCLHAGRKRKLKQMHNNLKSERSINGRKQEEKNEEGKHENETETESIRAVALVVVVVAVRVSVNNVLLFIY